MHRKRSSLRLIAVALGVAVAWGAVLIRPSFERPITQAVDAQGKRAPAAKHRRAQATAPLQPQPAPAPHASVAPSVADTVPNVGTLSDDQLTAEVAVVDQEIEDGDYIARANAGQLVGPEFEHFGGLLARRDALQIAKLQRLLASHDTRAQHAP
jgi:hypothetical protein